MPQSRRSVRRAVAVAAGLSAFAALVAVTSAPVAAPAAATTSTAQASAADAAAVVSGDARFEVLSPTLIRTEYAGDAHFVDAPTFNAIGRDGFARTGFTTSTADGWLSISTAALTLRYQVDSGAFTEKNLTVALTNGQQQVTAATVTVVGGDHGVFSLYEDDGTSTDPDQSSTTQIRYTKTGHGGQVIIDPVKATFAGQVDQRAWTVSFLDASAPTVVSVNGHELPAASWEWDSAQRKLTVTAPSQSVHKLLKVSYR